MLPTAIRFLASGLFLFLCGLPAAAQDPQRPADDRIDPQLRVDSERLAADGFLRERDLTLPAMRVVIELERQPGDATFETSTAADRVADVQASVIERQGAFVDRLERVLPPAQRSAVTILFPLELQYMLVAEIADGATLRAVAAVPGVRYVWKDNLNEHHTVQGRTLTGSSQQAALGWTGAGVGVAVIDTRLDLLHTELGGSTTLPNSVIKAGQNFSNPTTSIHSQSFNSCYHGTATCSIVHRYAPGADLYALVVFPNSFDSVIANAINWCVTNKNGVNGGAPIRVISMSLGGGQYSSPLTTGTLHNACATALANDIICCASTGNDGWVGSMGSPAASSSCIAIGATWDANGAPYTPFSPANCTDTNRQVDERTCYSDTASFLSFYCPSEQVICAQCGGGTFEFGGTSAACPAGAALIAQLLHARPNYIGDMAGVVSLFQSTGVPVIGDTTKRRVDLTAAMAAALPFQLRFTAFSIGGGLQQAGNTLSLSATVQNDGNTAGPFDVEFFLSNSPTWTTNDVYLGKTTVANLAASNSTVVQLPAQLPWRLVPGAYYVHAVLDRTNQVVEWNETDNEAQSGVLIAGGPCVTKLEYEDPLMVADANAEVSVTTGGAVHPVVVATCADPLNTLYLIVWGGSGTAPGFQLAPTVHLPLNLDAFTSLGLDALNGAVLVNFLGVLTAQGIGHATFALPPATGLTGVQTNLAVVLITSTELFADASNAVGLLLTP